MSVYIKPFLFIAILLPALIHCWWPFSSTESKDDSAEQDGADQVRTVVQFEMTYAEQKFLAESQQFLDLPQLDHCQHLVISKLRTSCGEMTEDGLGKLAVELFNCQSQAERRPTYSCSSRMTLAECTKDMDASTWNAYHIISNRARSVCYATRQEHFKRQTELAVNKLSRSTMEQLHSVQQLASSHQDIKEFAHESLQAMQSHQSELTVKQDELASRQDTVRDKITLNLEQLAKERTLIHNGQKKLVNMTENIKHQLKEASTMMSSQEESRRQGQSEIIEDITKVKRNIEQVWSRVDTSTSQLLKVMAEVSAQYKYTLNNLERINSSVNMMMSLVVAMDSAIAEQLEWLVGQLGGAQEGLRILILLATHAAFLLVATLCVLFVKAPGFARVALLLMVCANVYCGICYRMCLTIYVLAAIEALLIVGNWLYIWLRFSNLSQHLPAHFPESSQPLPLPDNTQHFDHTHTLSREDLYRHSTPISSDDDELSIQSVGGHRIETLTHTPAKPVRQSPLLRNSLATKCVAKTRTGSRCKILATPGENVCRKHMGLLRDGIR